MKELFSGRVGRTLQGMLWKSLQFSPCSGKARFIHDWIYQMAMCHEILLESAISQKRHGLLWRQIHGAVKTQAFL